jgi:hypothetical protein
LYLVIILAFPHRIDRELLTALFPIYTQGSWN